MLSTTTTVIAIAAAVGSGVTAGVLFAFSAFVMPALRTRPSSEGAAAMQEINVKAVTAPFMVAFVGTGVASLAVAWLAVTDWVAAASAWLVSGAALYVFGVFVLTAAFHVPRNSALAEIDPGTESGHSAWLTYAREWTLGNHVRSALGIAAAATLTIGVVVG